MDIYVVFGKLKHEKGISYKVIQSENLENAREYAKTYPVKWFEVLDIPEYIRILDKSPLALWGVKPKRADKIKRFVDLNRSEIAFEIHMVTKYS